jgi:hypothetical protein
MYINSCINNVKDEPGDLTSCSAPLSPGCRTNSAALSTNSVYSVTTSQPLASYNLTSLPAGAGAGAGAITMAAAQAVQATAQVWSSHLWSCCVV